MAQHGPRNPRHCRGEGAAEAAGDGGGEALGTAAEKHGLVLTLCGYAVVGDFVV